MFGLLLGFKRLGQCLARCFKKDEVKALLITTGSVLLLGTIFYHNVEKMAYIDSFYFSFVTLATIGYGDLYPVTVLGKLFTVVYSILGLGLVSLSAGIIAREVIQLRQNDTSEDKEKRTDDK